MSTCKRCGEDMSLPTTTTCKGNAFTEYVDGLELGSVPYEPGPYTPDRCRDCGMAPGGMHHLHCCVEQCARCGAQKLMCLCGGHGSTGRADGVNRGSGTVH